MKALIFYIFATYFFEFVNALRELLHALYYNFQIGASFGKLIFTGLINEERLIEYFTE